MADDWPLTCASERSSAGEWQEYKKPVSVKGQDGGNPSSGSLWIIERSKGFGWHCRYLNN